MPVPQSPSFWKAQALIFATGLTRDFLNRVFTAFHLCCVLKSLGGAVIGWQQVFIGSDGDRRASELTKAQLSLFLQAQRREKEDWWAFQNHLQRVTIKKKTNTEAIAFIKQRLSAFQYHRVLRERHTLWDVYMWYISHVTYTRVGQGLPSLVSGNCLWGSHGGSSSACTERVLHLLSSPREWPHHLPSLVSQKPEATYFAFSSYTCTINHWILSLLIPTCALSVTASNSVQPPPSHPVGYCKAFPSTFISLLRTRSPLPPPVFCGGHPPCCSKPKMNVPTWGECQKHLTAQPTALILRAGRMKVGAG